MSSFRVMLRTVKIKTPGALLRESLAKVSPGALVPVRGCTPALGDV